MHTLSDSEIQTLEVGRMVTLVIWILFLFALAIYLVICNTVGTEVVLDRDGTDSVFDIVKYILYAISLVLFTASYYLHKAIFAPRSTLNHIGRWLVGLQLFPLIFVYVKKERSVLWEYIPSMLNIFSLCVSIGIFGLIIFLIQGDWFALYILVGSAASMMVYIRPKKQELLDLALEIKELNNSSTVKLSSPP